MVNKITSPVTPLEVVNKINELVDDKQDTLVSGTNIKTVGGTSLLGSGNVSLPTGNDLFDHKWSDYQLNDQSWLRADTFSWQDGTVYFEAYNHLVAEYNSATASSTTYYAWYSSEDGTYYTLSPNVSAGDDVYVYYNNEFIATETVQSVETGYIIVSIGGGAPRALDRDSTKDIQVSSALQTETIAGTTITYYLVEDGHKIILPDQENNAVTIYTATGVAWYYILDTTNQRFKLPRENPVREELIQVIRAKGNGKTLGWYNGTTYYGTTAQDTYYTAGCLGGVSSNYGGAIGTSTGNTNTTSLKLLGITNDSTKSGIISSMTDSTSVYKGNKYLYFYVGQFSQSATEQTAGLNAELFNGKVDLNLNNMNPSASAKETIVGWGIPDYSSGVTFSANTNYTAPTNGYVVALGSVQTGAGYNTDTITVNGVTVSNVHTQTDGWRDDMSAFVSKGDIIKVIISGVRTADIKFYPLKGEVNA